MSRKNDGTLGADKPVITTWSNSFYPIERVKIIRIYKGGARDWFIVGFVKSRYLSGKKGDQPTIDYGGGKRECHQHDVWGRW